MDRMYLQNRYSDELQPLTFLREVGELRIGILTLRESWQLALGLDELPYGDSSPRENLDVEGGGRADMQGDWYITVNALPSPELVAVVKSLPSNAALRKGEELIALRYPEQNSSGVFALEQLDTIEYEGELEFVKNPWDVFRYADCAIRYDFDRLTAGRSSQPLSSTVGVLGGGQIFLEPGAKAEFCTLNASEGPIYLGRDSEVMEGVHVRGPLALGEHSTLKMGAKIYGATSIGPHCKVGGEVSNSVIQGYSNKAHDGFLGNAAIGYWCNLGADTNCSNLKNDYSPVRVWSCQHERFIKTGLQFCGLIMGDHSKAGINTMFNTGTVVGAFCNVFGDGFPRNWIPSFSWGGASGFKIHDIEKALQTAKIVMARRGMELPGEEEARIREFYRKSTTPRE